MAINPFWMNAFGQNVASAGSGPVPRGVMAAEPTTGTGLFGANPEQRDMLLTLGMNLLAGSGYSPQKRTTGEILGSAMLAAQQSQAATRDRMMKQKLQEAQLAQMEREARAPIGVSRGETLIDPETREVVFTGSDADSAFGNIDPSKFTVESLAKFQQTGNYGDLVPTSGGANLGNYNPGDYTPESWAAFARDGYKDPSVLRRYVTPANPSVNIIGGVPTMTQGSRIGGPTRVEPLSTLGSETDAARRLKEAEATGAAFGTVSGEIAGGILKKGSDAKAVGGLLEDADALIDVATGSTAGAARDKVAAVFGYAPTSAQAIAELQVLQANLMLQQPRMEGPQGVLDVQLYQQMAGQIGDPKVPAPQKKAALRRIRQLQEKYVERAEGAKRGSQPPYTEGQTATNPKTGEKLVFRGGRWQKP